MPETTLPRVEKIIFNGQSAWVKRPEVKRNSIFVFLHSVLEFFLPKVLYRTGASGDMQAIKSEAERIKKFEDAALPVPRILDLNEERLILLNVGNQLRKVLRGSKDRFEQQKLMQLAIEALHSIHAAGFCHGRPFLKDMTVDANGKLYFLDLEEDPCTIMSLQDAQARDLWLFLASCTEFCEDPLEELNGLLNQYNLKGRPDITPNLRALGRSLRPFRHLIAILHIKNIGHDIAGAYWSARVLDK